jgi:hypothetical protein
LNGGKGNAYNEASNSGETARERLSEGKRNKKQIKGK